MATTTNYGWTTPNDTDLVKDGAAAIRTLGSSIDTTTKALNPSTTLGDIEYRSATANTNTRLGIGTSGQVLSVSGGVPAWVTSSAGSLTLLSTTTMSGASTTVSSIDQTYTDLVIIASGFYGSNAQGVIVEPNGVTSGLYIGGFKGTGTDDNNEFMTPNMQTSATSLSIIVLEIKRYATTSYAKPIQIYGSSRPAFNYSYMMGGTISSTSAVNSIKFSSAFVGTFSGNQIAIYGVK